MTEKHPVSLAALDASLVCDYLMEHPDFLIQHPELLRYLTLVESQEGVVSLVQKQQHQLRLHIRQLEEDVTELLTMASNQERTFRGNLEGIMTLLASSTQAQWRERLQVHLQSFYGIQAVAVIAVDNPIRQKVWQRYLSEQVYLGTLSEEASQMLFGQTVGSVALLPFHCREQTYLLGFAHFLPEYFHSQYDCLLLIQLRQLIAYQWPLLDAGDTNHG
ncbi:MAG: DUF484 family protein [Shewanellaceae bacterium]|nr:DUF484 family protein [Shewanellaceae bacterium]